MKRFVALCVIAVAAVGMWPTASTSRAQTCFGGTIFTGVDLIPMDVDGVLRNQTVIVHDGIISAVGPSSEIEQPDGFCVIDANGQYLMPGLVDAHAHLFDDGDLTLYLQYGVTSILNMSGSYQHIWLRDRLRRGEMDGPSLYTTGPMIKMSAMPLVEFEDNPVDPETAARIVARHAAAGYDMIKVWGSFDPETYAAIMDAARELGIPVTGHIPSAVGLDATLQQGQLSIAHIEELFARHFNDQPTPEGISAVTAQLAEAGATVSTTLVTYEAIAGAIMEDEFPLMSREGVELMDPARLSMWAPDSNRYRTEERLGHHDHYLGQMEQMQHITFALDQGGVRLLAGVDGGELPGLVPGLDLHRELELLVEAGLSPHAALMTATSNFGDYVNELGIDEDRMGVIAVGARADLLLLNANPLEDISNTRAIAGVMTRGTYYRSDDLDALTDELIERNRATGAYFAALMEGGPDGGAQFLTANEEENGAPVGFVPTLFFAFGQIQGGDPMGGSATLLQLAEMAPHRHEPWFVIAGLRLIMEDPHGALAAYDEALARAPDHERVLRDRARLAMLLEAGD